MHKHPTYTHASYLAYANALAARIHVFNLRVSKGAL